MNYTKLIATFGTTALALTTIPHVATAATTEITICVNKKSGDLRQTNPTKKCKKTERRLVLNAQGSAGQMGPPGPPGPQGATGAQGITGPAGSNGASGPTGATGPTGPSRASFYYGQADTLTAGHVETDLYNFTATEPGDYMVNGTVVFANATTPTGTISEAMCLAYSYSGDTVINGETSIATILQGSHVTIPVSTAAHTLAAGDGLALRCSIAPSTINPSEILTSTFTVVQVASVTLIPEPD